MILRPCATAGHANSDRIQPAWPVIEETQKNCGRPCWIITQPDHAALSGAIAQALAPPVFEPLPAEVIEGIALHDKGWAQFDDPMPADRELRSFFDVSAETALAAWRGSIERAESAAPMAGAIVSRHFWRITQTRIAQAKDGPDELAELNQFLSDEEVRERRLASSSWQQMEHYTDVLQFCDVLSLYLCCGATEDVSFPQKFRGVSPVLRREWPAGESIVCRFEPSPFGRGVDLGIPARRHPDGKPQQFAVVMM